MKPLKIGSSYDTVFKEIERLRAAGSLWQAEASAVIGHSQESLGDPDHLLEFLHQAQRLNTIGLTGLANNADFRAAFQSLSLPSWKDFTAPPAAPALQDALAEKLYNADPATDRFVLINVGDGAREIGQWLVRKCQADGIAFHVNFSDGDFTDLVLNHADEAGVRALAQNVVRTAAPARKVMSVRPGVPDRKRIQADPAKAQIYALETRPYGARISSGDLFYTLTVIPTRKDAEIDGIPYDDYIKLFFEMCDQPWARIGEAQKALIREFDAADFVRITNDDGTDVSMSLIDHDGSHFTFCNSLIGKNVPGSEIFSAPRLDSVNGIVMAKGKFSNRGDDGIIENLTMEFENGYLKTYSAESGLSAFEEAIFIDAGARFVGELGIGTNPHLKRHVVNGLLVEKIGGSFHLALGKPYTYTDYIGDPVKVNNGGNSALHWDITTMLWGKGGRIYLDGRLVMDDGMWLDAKYDVLNRGWAAVPVAERPDYWQDKTG